LFAQKKQKKKQHNLPLYKKYDSIIFVLMNSLIVDCERSDGH